MDYLKALPVEIWREILSNIPSHWRYGGILSHRPLCLYDDNRLGYKLGRNDQRQLAQSLLVCKQLTPLVEEVLYTDVCLKTVHICNGDFERLARVMHTSTSRLRGEWTRVIRVDVSQVDQLSSLCLSGRISTICPNLEAYHQIDDAIRSITGQSNGLEGDVTLGLLPGWLTTITVLTLSGYQISWIKLQFLFQACHNLETLTLLAMQIIAHPARARLTPLKLKRLTMNARFSGVELFSSRDIEQLTSLLQNFGETLVALHLIHEWTTHLRSSRAAPSHILDYCPRIRHLEIAFVEQVPELTAGHKWNKFHPLETLTILLPADTWDSILTKLAPQFSKNMFPNLKKVNIILSKEYASPGAEPTGHVEVAPRVAAKRVFPWCEICVERRSGGLF
ncbi:hypothetical protein FRC14_006856 [Serendipita sp. 396]|nr:hypothetical protein FRC14_006856 [Serendipita sp. 396]KAG8877815.1 hypothetical protein FRC20_010067 [Serendipita sp. 405]